MSYDYLFKFIIVGDTGVGKSCLLLQFVDKRFRQKHEVTIGVEFGARQIELHGYDLKFQIWDTAGQETFRCITKSYYKGACGAIVVFDITNRQSFNNIQSWFDDVLNYGHISMCIVLVGNKSDLEEERVVTFEEAQALSKEKGFEYVETSSKAGINVDEAFMKIGLSVLDKILNSEIDPKCDTYGVKIGQGKKDGLKINNENLQQNKQQQNKCC